MDPLAFISCTGTNPVALCHALPPSPSLRDRTGAAGPYLPKPYLAGSFPIRAAATIAGTKSCVSGGRSSRMR